MNEEIYLQLLLPQNMITWRLKQLSMHTIHCVFVSITSIVFVKQTLNEVETFKIKAYLHLELLLRTYQEKTHYCCSLTR